MPTVCGPLNTLCACRRALKAEVPIDCGWQLWHIQSSLHDWPFLRIFCRRAQTAEVPIDSVLGDESISPQMLINFYSC